MPLIIPKEHLVPYKIVAIDPGSNFLGLSVLEIDPNCSILSIVSQTLNVESLVESAFENRDIQSNRVNKQLKIETELYRIFTYYKPLLVICESPFYNRLRPGAFAPLVEVLSAIQRTVINYNQLVPFTTVEPSVIKKSIGAGHICGKEEVKAALMATPEILNALTTNLNYLDEHAIDSIAVGYTYVLQQRRLLMKER